MFRTRSTFRNRSRKHNRGSKIELERTAVYPLVTTPGTLNAGSMIAHYPLCTRSRYRYVHTPRYRRAYTRTFCSELRSYFRNYFRNILRQLVALRWKLYGVFFLLTQKISVEPKYFDDTKYEIEISYSRASETSRMDNARKVIYIAEYLKRNKIEIFPFSVSLRY